MWSGPPCHAPSAALTIPVCNVTPAPIVRICLIVRLNFAVNIIHSVDFDKSSPYRSWPAVTGRPDDLAV